MHFEEVAPQGLNCPYPIPPSSSGPNMPSPLQPMSSGLAKLRPLRWHEAMVAAELFQGCLLWLCKPSKPVEDTSFLVTKTALKTTSLPSKLSPPARHTHLHLSASGSTHCPHHNVGSLTKRISGSLVLDEIFFPPLWFEKSKRDMGNPALLVRKASLVQMRIADIEGRIHQFLSINEIGKQ